MGTIEVRSLLHPVVGMFEGADADLESEFLDTSTADLASHLGSWRYAHLKRAVDVIGSLTLFAAFAVPGILCALSVLLTSPGPIFYRETRIGRYGRSFRIWKFRTMAHGIQDVTEASDCSSESLMRWRTEKDIPDPRITRTGRFLRRWSLDEIPQILNVIRGEMSLIGPRPVIHEEIALYGDLQHFYLAARPGLSGLWQVSGRSNLSFANRAYLDAHYVRSWTMRQDLRLLVRTVPAVLNRDGAR
jgi:lipopolysaccharide/colanic/teichoic acid biosynthesis glycosyltransferase